VEKLILFLILAVLWLMIIFNRKLKITINRTARQLNLRGGAANWSTCDCDCGTQRVRWQALAMNRPDNTVLLMCPTCNTLWEEQMSLYGNKWRAVEKGYARENYNYCGDNGRLGIGT